MKIAIAKIRPNPNNPRNLIKQEMIDSLAGSIAEIGLKNPIKLAILTPGEKQKDPEYDYEVVDGMMRLLAAQKLGWAEIEAEVKELDPKERFKESVIGNRGQGFFWLDLYTSIDHLMSDDPKLTQKQVADIVEVDPRFASNSIKALSLLNKSARESILAICKNSADWEPSEAAVLALTKLAKGQPDDASRLEQALRVVLDRRMTEKQAKKLVSWIKKGNSPESFPVDGKLSGIKGSKQQNFDLDDPNAGVFQALPRNIQMRRTAKGEYELKGRLKPYQAPLVAGVVAAYLKELELRMEGSKDGGNKYYGGITGADGGSGKGG